MPTGRLLQYVPLGKYTGFNVVAWGIVLSFHAAATNTIEILALRFFLGFFEFSVSPGMLNLQSWDSSGETNIEQHLHCIPRNGTQKMSRAAERE